MARVRILRRQNGAYIELPKEILHYDELELFQLRDGYYLLTVPLGTAGNETKTQGKAAGAAVRGEAVRGEAGTLSPAERTVLKKLLGIRFEKRTPAYVGKALSEPELAVLRELERKDFVNVFRGQKYKDGVYNIRDSIYPLLSESGQKVRGAAAGQPMRGSAAAGHERGAASTQVSSTQVSSSTYPGVTSLLSSRGFIIINDKNEARILSEQLAQEMKKGAVVGVKGFDGKFYVVTRPYFTKAQEIIASVLKEPMDCDSIAAAAKLDADGCRAALRLMAENGDVIEKKRGIFAAV
jgi:hypothetical protein